MDGVPRHVSVRREAVWRSARLNDRALVFSSRLTSAVGRRQQGHVSFRCPTAEVTKTQQAVGTEPT